MYVTPEWKSQSKRVGEVEGRAIEISIQNPEEKKIRKKKKNEQSLRDL